MEDEGSLPVQLCSCKGNVRKPEWKENDSVSTQNVHIESTLIIIVIFKIISIRTHFKSNLLFIKF